MASEGISVFVIETPERPLPVHHGGRRGKRVADEAGRDTSPDTRATGLQNRGRRMSAVRDPVGGIL